jgi:hypothetical protein
VDVVYNVIQLYTLLIFGWVAVDGATVPRIYYSHLLVN